MRIISGKYRRRRFDLPKNIDARPTMDMARENLFNILNNLFDWEETYALDLFAGTGAIGLELVSRGCPSVICVESKSSHTRFIEEVKNKLGAEELTVFKTDVFKYIGHTNQQFDFIFADPPFDLKNFDEVPKLVLASNMLKEDGLFILEHPRSMDFSEFEHFDEKRICGSVNFSFFRKK